MKFYKVKEEILKNKNTMDLPFRVIFYNKKTYHNDKSF